MGDVLKKKDYPLNYPDDILKIFNALAYNIDDVKVMGSASLRSQQYSADYDLFEVVKSNAKRKEIALRSFASGLQRNIRELRKIPYLSIGDIKCGEISDWKVIEGDVKNNKVIGYDYERSKAKVETLCANNVLSTEECEQALKLLKPNPTPVEFLDISYQLRPHILRWTPKDILKGHLILRNGTTVTLTQAIDSPAITKVDVVAYVQNNRFTDFSIIYQYKYKSSTVNEVKSDMLNELKKNILTLYSEGDYYKMAKRIFSLEKDYNYKLIKNLSDMFNSDLGRLYSLISDMKTLMYVLEEGDDIPYAKIRFEFDSFRARLGSIYTIKGINTPRILEMIADVPKSEMYKMLEMLSDDLNTKLQTATAKHLKTLKLLPLPKKYLP